MQKKFEFNLILLSLIFLFSSLHCGIIIPDQTNPIMMNKPGMGQKGYIITVTFTMPSDSIGLGYQQFIGLTFPKLTG
jgi:hypothetical protein